ncbi:MAG: glycerol kinase GlpK [Phycisphaerales bacterium]
MAGTHVLALDQGTSSSRSVVVDGHGRIVASSQREFRQHFPRPGWVEHDADEIWETQLATAREALTQAGLSARDLAGVGITNQRETVLLWERATGRPVAHAVVWQDRRTSEAMDALRRDGHEEQVGARTGLRLDPYFSASKLAWLLDNVQGARARAARGELAAGTIDSWLLWKLTGGGMHATDVTNASRTLLMDLRRGAWDEEMLRLFRVPREVLPEVRPSAGGAAFGETEAGLLGGAVPVAAILGDQQAALFGQGCVTPGMAKSTYGTGCFLLVNTGERLVPSRSRLLTTVAWQMAGQPAQYALEGSVFVGGSAVQWLRDGLGIIRTAPEVNELAASVPDSGGVVVVPAFTGLGAPYWDAEARGTILGLTRGSTAAHVARATLEAVAMQVADVLVAMQKDIGASVSVLRVDGGASASDLLMQFQADVMGVRVERPSVLESTAMGAALMAGLAAGLWKDVSALERVRRVDRSFSPLMTAAERERRMRVWHRAVERSTHWAEPA